ncbi:MAG: tetratricopeptide repeat protein [Gemmatimonadaceae bacterium]|nr:tetratricopeptide repeat protein [Gemmatimonadaceae bacterium]
MRIQRVLLVLSLLALAAPAAKAQRSDPIARLEAARAANPRNVAALRALGVAYYKAQRYADARTVLDQARQLDPRDGVSALYAGLSAEQLQDYTGARNAYDSYLRVGRTRRVRNQIRERLVAMSAAEAEAAAKAAVANEARLSQTPGNPRTIAVPPFKFEGPDAEQLAPLERGLADLVITDLSRSSQLTIVERDRMQALADEIALGQSGRVDSSSAVRAGRLMQAGRLVNGSMIQGGNELTLASRIVDVSTSQLTAPVQVTNSLDNIFAMQKQLVFQIFDQLGVTLTPAERQLVDRQATSNLNAFLAYSRGLQASDDGRFEDASRFFDEARGLDPGFGAASARFNAAQAAMAGAQISTANIESSLSGSSEGQQVAAAERGIADAPLIENTLRNTVQDVNPPTVSPISNTNRPSGSPAAPQRDPTSTTTGTDSPVARTGTVTVIIRRP